MVNLNLMQGDCLVKMKDIEAKSIDMILCDLPYGETNNPKDIVIDFDTLWQQYNRIIKDNGCIALFAQGDFYIDLVCSNRNMFRYDLVWDKGLVTGFLNANRMPLRKHEQIAIFYKSLPTYNPQFTKGQPLHSRGQAYKSKNMVNHNYNEYQIIDDYRKGSTDKYPTSILSFTKSHPMVANHATEKPVSLLEYLINTYTNEGDTVLDNCMGSGSTGVACINTKRNFVGIELDKEIYNNAENRLLNENLKIVV